MAWSESKAWRAGSANQKFYQALLDDAAEAPKRNAKRKKIIHPEDMPHVFDRFWRASGAPSGGTGLGLAIAKWIVDRHRGFITVSNREGGGAHFRVQLPSIEGAPA